MARLPAQRVCASIIKLSPVSSEQRRCGVVACANEKKLANEKKSPSQWRFSCEKMGIYVITYKAKGFSVKNMPRRHLTDGPQQSDTLSIRINTRLA